MSKLGKIGIFDSGNGGLQIAQAIFQLLPNHEYEFLGDNKNLPYGEKSQQQIQGLVVQNLITLFNKDCELVIIACNTASAKALRFVQQKWLKENYPNKKVLGVIVPTLEKIKVSMFPALVIATKSTIGSNVYKTELGKLHPEQKLFQKATPSLAGLIEAGDISRATQQAIKTIQSYKPKVRTIILGCTHYAILEKPLRHQFQDLQIISQTKIIPNALKRYLKRHPEIETRLSTKSSLKVSYTKKTQS